MRTWPAWSALVALLVLAAGLRVFHLDYRSLNTDEANLYWMAQGSFEQVALQNAAGNSAPPLYAWAINLTSRLGRSEAALRALSCAAGVLALLPLFALARRYSDTAGAGFAVLLAALAPSQVFYSQFLREYSLAFLLAALLLLAFDTFQRRASITNGLAYAGLAVLAVYVQYGLALLLLALNLVAAVELIEGRERGRRLALWSLAQLPALAAAWLVYDGTLRHQLRPGGFGADYLAAGYWDGSRRSLTTIVLGNTFELVRFAYPAIFLLQALVLLGMVGLWRTADGRRAVLLLVVPIAVTIAAACARLYPFLGARQSIALTAMLYVCAGAGFEQLRRLDWRGVGATVAIVWALAEGAYGLSRQLWSVEPQHMRPLAAELAARFRDGDRVYVYHDAVTPLLYYYPDHQRAWIRGVYGADDPAAHRAQIGRELAAPGRVWLVLSNCRAGECEVIRRAAAALRPVEKVASEVGATLWLADAPPQIPSPLAREGQDGGR